MLSLISEVLRLPLANLSLSRLATDSSPALAFRGDNFSPEEKNKTPESENWYYPACRGVTWYQEWRRIHVSHLIFFSHIDSQIQNSKKKKRNSAFYTNPWTEVLTRFVLLCDGEGAGSAKHHQVQQRVSAQPVSAVDTGTCRLTTGIQSRNHLVSSIGVSDDLMGKY